MSPRFRRTLCRIAFLLGCLLPTSMTVATLVERNWLGSLVQLQQELSSKTGLNVRLAGVRYPLPGVTLLDGLELSDPETGATLVRCRLAEWTQTRRGLAIHLSHAELDGTHLCRLAEVFHDRVLRYASSDLDRVTLSAGEATLHTSGTSQTLTDLVCSMQGSGDGPKCTVEFRLAGIEMPRPAQLNVTRNRQLDPPATRWEFQTGGAFLPVATLARELPRLAVLGGDAQFRGSCTITAAEGKLQGDLTGQWIGVDLDRLVTDTFPHKLSGTAQITLHDARWEDGRLTGLAGELAAGPGVIGSSLLLAARTHLQLVLSPRTPAEDGGLLPYRRLGLAFALRGEGLELGGLASDALPDAALTDDTGVLAQAPRGPARPAVGLLRTLAPLSEVQVPATRETQLLVGALPAPQIVPPAAGIARPPRAKIRWNDGSDTRLR